VRITELKNKALADLLNEDFDPEDRASAARTLGECGSTDRRVIRALIAALKYRGPYVPLSPAAAAIDLVLPDSYKEMDQIVRRLRSRWRWRSKIRETLKSLEKKRGIWLSVLSVDPFNSSPEAEQELDAYLNGLSSVTSREAALSLASELRRSHKAHTISGDSHILRVNAAEALGSLRPKEAIPALIQSLHDDDDGVRVAAADALANIGEKSAIEPIIEAIRKNRLDLDFPMSNQWPEFLEIQGFLVRHTWSFGIRKGKTYWRLRR
jgi:HEAT repeat protein